MIIELAKLSRDGQEFVGQEPGEIVDLAEENGVCIKSPVSYKLRAQVVSNELVTSGELKVSVAFQCSRCSTYFDILLQKLPFERIYDVDPNTEVVDLTPDIREAIILAFPTYPVCSPECKGLCSQCGTDLNKATCECKPPSDGRWGALENLNVVEN